MKNKKHLEFHSFNNTSFFVKNAKPKAVEIKFSKKSNDIASKNEYGISGAWSFSKESEEDNFEDNIKRDFFPLLGQGKRQIKDGIKEIIENKKLFDMKDRDIEECKVLLDIEGRRKKFYMIDENNFASRVPLDILKRVGGHPDYDEVKNKIIEVLKSDVLSVKENV